MAERIISKKAWTGIARQWDSQMPPERPSSGEIRIYEDHLFKVLRKCKGKCRALLLGATPELRDVLAKLKIDTTLVDVNPVFIRAMDSLLKYSKNKEKKIIANWLDIPLKSDEFDVILSDHGLHWIRFSDWDKFFREQVRLLKKGGYLIHNIVTMPKHEEMTIGQVIKSFKENRFSREDKFYYQYRAMQGMPDKLDKYQKDLNDYNTELKKYFKKGLINKNDFDFLANPWSDFHPVMAPKEKIDEAISRYFIIRSVETNSAHLVYTCHKIYFGEVRK